MGYQKKSEYVERLEAAVKVYEDLIRELPLELKRCYSSQRNMAGNIGINPNTISNWLKDPGQVPPNKLKGRVSIFLNTFGTAKR